MRRTPSPPASDPALERLQRLAHFLDASIPLPFGIRIGWEAVLGLVPGVGDGAGALLSAYVVVQAARMGAPPHVLTRMVGNVALEALVGAVPLLGDLFDAGFKANLRNVRLLEAHLGRTAGLPRRASRASLVGVVLVLALVLGAGLVLAWLVLSWIVRLASGAAS